jgi:hypothetical protein
MKLLNNIITQRGGIFRIKQNQKPKTQSIKNLNSVDKQFILLHNAVQFCFNEIAKINKWSAKDINDALNEYFNKPKGIKKINDFQIIKQGGSGNSYNTLNKFLQWMRGGIHMGIGAMVGTFDTPCNVIISLIAIGTWCVVVYNTINNISPDEARRSLAQPVQYVIYNKAPELYEMEENVTKYMVDYVDKNISLRIKDILYQVTDSTTIINTVRTVFWESNLYTLFIVKPISCLLSPIIPSCKVNCGVVDERKRSGKRSKKRSGKRSGSKKRSGNKKRSSKRSKKRSSSKSIYLTPREE